jgi:hypothetical protein
MTYTAYVETGLYQAGHACDGHPHLSLAYYVSIENERGRRFRHFAVWLGTEHQVCEETGESYFPDHREESLAKAERLCARVNAALRDGTGVDWAYWVETDPAYGSEEYIAQGVEAERAFADRQEG